MNVYLDYAATTPPAFDVLQAMLQTGEELYGNPSSPHFLGRKARLKIEEVRDRLSSELNCKPAELIFTSGGTESNNLAFLGTTQSKAKIGRHIIISAVEHPSVMKTCLHLEKSGFSVTRILPQSSGTLSLIDIDKHLRPDTGMVSVMAINNETGIMHPVKEISDYCKTKNILFHCDAIQSFGKYPLDLQEFKADLVSFSAHKIFGPKGIGVLYIREGIAYNSINFGGSQELNRRSGTENIMGIAGLHAAIDQFCYDEHLKNVSGIQAYFEQQLKENISEVQIIGEKLPRSAYISAVSFPGYNNSSIIMNLDLAGVAVSSGSACSSGSIEPSRVLLAMKLSEEIRKGTLRFSFAPFTTTVEIDYVVEQLVQIIKKIPSKAAYA